MRVICSYEAPKSTVGRQGATRYLPAGAGHRQARVDDGQGPLLDDHRQMGQPGYIQRSPKPTAISNALVKPPPADSDQLASTEPGAIHVH